MKSKGFTLIELLAVIVILAIIALIAVPIVISIVNDSEEKSNQRSVEMYAKAIENSVMQYRLDYGKKINGIFKVEDNEGKILKSKTDDEIKLTIEYDGNVICKAIEIKEDGNIYLAGCIVNDSDIEYAYDNEGKEHLSYYNVRAVTEETKTTGNVPTTDENGNIVLGSEFKIKVNDKSDYETFFVLSNEENYVNLIAEQNITSTGEIKTKPQDNDKWYATTNNNRYGPQTAYAYLSSATSNWTNVPIIESFSYLDEGNRYQEITTKLNKTTGKYITTITPNTSVSTTVSTYENMRVRLPKYSEVTASEVGCTTSSGTCPLWMVNYLASSDYYSADEGKVVSTSNGYWTLSSLIGHCCHVRIVLNSGAVSSYDTTSVNHGIRPVITILKSDLLRVMQ